MMQADTRFSSQSKVFLANVRTIGQALGYTEKKQIRLYTLSDFKHAMEKSGLVYHHLMSQDDTPTPLANALMSYFQYRSEILNTYVEPRLMDAERAGRVFEEYYELLKPRVLILMNKQKGEKRQPAYLTGLVNMLIEAHSDGLPCDYNPRQLTSFTRDGVPLRTLARRVDGCFPGCVNPIAIWEIKEYYYTTTFGSRIAD